MFYEYEYEENEKYIDTEELLSTPRPIVDNTPPDLYEYEDDYDNNDDRQKEFTYKRYQKARAELNMDSIEREAMKQRQRQKQKSL